MAGDGLGGGRGGAREEGRATGGGWAVIAVFGGGVGDWRDEWAGEEVRQW